MHEVLRWYYWWVSKWLLHLLEDKQLFHKAPAPEKERSKLLYVLNLVNNGINYQQDFFHQQYDLKSKNPRMILSWWKIADSWPMTYCRLGMGCWVTTWTQKIQQLQIYLYINIDDYPWLKGKPILGMMIFGVMSVELWLRFWNEHPSGTNLVYF